MLVLDMNLLIFHIKSLVLQEKMLVLDLRPVEFSSPVFKRFRNTGGYQTQKGFQPISPKVHKSEDP